VGFLQVQTRDQGETSDPLHVPREEFTIARVKEEIFSHSYIGAMFVNRQGGTYTAYNRGAGVDSEIYITDNWLVQAFLMGTATPGVRSSYLSGRVDSRFENARYRLIGVYEDIGTHFNPEIGFVERTGIRQYFGQAAYTPQPRFIPGVRSMEFETQLEYYADRTGHLSTRQTELTWNTTFNNSSNLFFRPVEDHTEVLSEPFEISDGIVIPSGSYRFNRPILGYTSDASKKISFEIDEQWGKFFGGYLSESNVALVFRPNEHFVLDVADGINRVTLPEGDFTTNLVLAHASVNLSRKLLTSTFAQVNSEGQITGVNVRFRYNYRPNSDFYIIYNQTTGRGLEAAQYSLQFKLTYDFTF
jgi:hypothetical protein